MTGFKSTKVPCNLQKHEGWMTFVEWRGRKDSKSGQTNKEHQSKSPRSWTDGAADPFSPIWEVSACSRAVKTPDATAYAERCRVPAPAGQRHFLGGMMPSKFRREFRHRSAFLVSCDILSRCGPSSGSTGQKSFQSYFITCFSTAGNPNKAT